MDFLTNHSRKILSFALLLAHVATMGQGVLTFDCHVPRHGDRVTTIEVESLGTESSVSDQTVWDFSHAVATGSRPEAETSLVKMIFNSASIVREQTFGQEDKLMSSYLHRISDQHNLLLSLINIEKWLNIYSNDTLYMVDNTFWGEHLLFTSHDGVSFDCGAGNLRIAKMDLTQSFPILLDLLNRWDVTSLENKESSMRDDVSESIITRCVIKDGVLDEINCVLVVNYKSWGRVKLLDDTKARKPQFFYWQDIKPVDNHIKKP